MQKPGLQPRTDRCCHPTPHPVHGSTEWARASQTPSGCFHIRFGVPTSPQSFTSPPVEAGWSTLLASPTPGLSYTPQRRQAPPFSFKREARCSPREAGCCCDLPATGQIPVAPGAHLRPLLAFSRIDFVLWSPLLSLHGAEASRSPLHLNSREQPCSCFQQPLSPEHFMPW